VRGQASPGKHSSLIVDKDVQMLDESEKNIFTLLWQSYFIWLREQGQISYLLCKRVQCANVCRTKRS
jgi:hypothetical protein